MDKDFAGDSDPDSPKARRKSDRTGSKESSTKKKSSKSSHESQSKKDPLRTTSSKEPTVKRFQQQKTLWELAIDIAAEKKPSNAEDVNEEKAILFVGSKDAGKTTIMLRFLDRDEAPKPTTALEYTYVRRPRSNNLDKDVAHLWELGGGTWLSKLTDVVITGDSIRNMSVALILDLSKPNEMWLTLEKWLAELTTRIDMALREPKAEEMLLREKLKKEAWIRVGDDHQDRDMMDPFLIPLVIIGAKYDIFQDFDPEKRKVICKTLRFVAHRYGAHLQFFSTKHEALINKARATISSFVFATPASKNTQTDVNKPILVTAGQDTFQQIGSPPLPEGDLGRVMAKTPMDLWKHAFVTYFPQENIADPSLVEDPARDKQYAEPAVDAMRAQRDQELERYRKLSERRARETAQKPMVEGFA